MQGENALRTVEECLRGRLLAERAASKTATDTADLFTNKVRELEEKLKKEEKSRRKAEKKLNNLKKKLESLKIGFNYNDNNNNVWEESDECSIISFSTSDQFSEKSCLISPSTSTSTSTASNSSSAAGDGDLHPRSVSFSDNVDSGDRTESDIKVEKDQRTDELSRLKPSTLEEEKENEENRREEDDDEHIDESMALVPLSLPMESNDHPSNKEVKKINNERVREVLDTLKQIKENIQSTMERRRLIQVG